MLDGSEQAASRAARTFAADLSARYGKPAQLVDERHSSQEAAQRFAARRAGGRAKRKDAATLDAVAAEIIVERWLDHAHSLAATHSVRPDAVEMAYFNHGRGVG